LEGSLPYIDTNIKLDEMYGNPKYRKDTSSDLMLKPKK
jgi:hypothetical protein